MLEIYRYTKLASEAGKSNLIGLAILVLFAIFVFYKKIGKNGDPTQSQIIVIIVIVGFILYAAQTVLKQLNSTGSWEIIVDDKTLQWNAPRDVEESFIINLDQIKKIEKTIRNQDTDYEIKLKGNDEDIKLTSDSGVDLDELLEALEVRGVAIDEIDDRNE